MTFDQKKKNSRKMKIVLNGSVSDDEATQQNV